ncbi:MAG: tRNA (guanosine(37)-N1)-methyltransferase TrmD [Gammaproteobacteria bacterium]|jgi:tRNA (guanine37-N1)-methyltransferase|nr:tRNA (guanosine(37)-N1)-methyltransferase TrmD [Gammaproteobacteria bacterium]|tara:strand:+ start:2633 stop:3388 length:756 start_codon:yes stop_codon:yes gene_type:complete
MWLGIISLFPEMFRAISESGITRRAIEAGILELDFWNPRDFTTDKHRTVDDKPYGGGPGMLMKVSPLRDAIRAARARAARVKAGSECKVIYLSPQGEKLDQEKLVSLSASGKLILVAGRYEGIDERVVEQEIDAEYSIGDYVLSGGELPAMVLIDGMTRLLPGAVGDPESVTQDSFAGGLLDYPQYTRPEEVDGEQVPSVLLSGDHEKIKRWRLKQSLGRTYKRRPDLIEKMDLGEDEKKLLDEYLEDDRQ